MKERKISKVWQSNPTLEGAGVHLNRVFGNLKGNILDPFLLLDDFHSFSAPEYMKGFPSHPHRGIETITYMLHGEIEHKDSMGNGGVIRPNEVQWMTAGSGIIHSEMPISQGTNEFWGFQLWANLPASHKMMDPRYREITKDMIPNVVLENGTKIKIICGRYNDVDGPVQDIITQPEYFDVLIPSNCSFSHIIPDSHTVFAYIIQGDALFPSPEGGKDSIGKQHIVVLEDGDQLTISTKESDCRILLVSGKPIGEPIAWYGPIVMNTQQELQVAFEELQRGNFLKYQPTNSTGHAESKDKWYNARHS